MQFLRCTLVAGVALVSCAQWVFQAANGHAVAGQEPRILVRLWLEEIASESVTFDVQVSNPGGVSVYLVVDTSRADGSGGPYVSLNADTSTLELQMRLFAPPAYNLYSNGTAAHLKLLHPGDKYMHRFSVARPIITTEPPYSWDMRGKSISDAAIAQARAIVSVLPATKEVEHLADPKTGPPSVNGLETIQDSKSSTQLYELQALFYSAAVPILHR